MQRVMIIGGPGAGKSTLAKRLGALLQLPVVHLDQHYFRPNWVEPNQDVWREQVEDLAREPAWVMDGNYGGTMPIRIARADMIVLLDFPTRTCLVRVWRRLWKYYGKVRPDMQPDCRERFSLGFLIYVARFRRDKIATIMERLAPVRDTKKIVVCRDQAEVEAFVASVRRSSGSGD